MSASLPPNLANISLDCRDFAKSSLLIPTALANASCWILFIAVNSAADPACLAISSATVAKSLFNAAVLAFSKLRFLPSNNSASNSLDIDCSKFIKLLAIPSTSDNSIPNCLAVWTALANSTGLLAMLNCILLDNFATSCKIDFSVIAVPLAAFIATDWPITLAAISFDVLPVSKPSFAISPLVSALNPNWCVNSVWVCNISAVNIALVPRAADSCIWEFAIPSVVTNILFESCAIWENCEFIPTASW